MSLRGSTAICMNIRLRMKPLSRECGHEVTLVKIIRAERCQFNCVFSTKLSVAIGSLYHRPTSLLRAGE